MSFEMFAAQHGLIIKSLVHEKWVRVRTVDHKSKLNGSYKYLGDVGWVINFATMQEHAMWRTENPQEVDYTQIRHRILADEKRRLEAHNKAASKAAWMLNSSRKMRHEYLCKKGFPEEKGWVWKNLMIVPMRINDSLVGLQVVTEGGEKRFLTGQQTKGATAVFDNKGVVILCEGYATALSIRRAMKSVRQRYKIVVCFSASNMVDIAKQNTECFVVADNDKAGIDAAKAAGKTYWLSDVEGEDFNDYEIRNGALGAGESLLSVLKGSDLLAAL